MLDSDNINENNKRGQYILENRMVKKSKRYLLKKKVKHKFLVKVRPFSAAKVSCMVDHVKTTIRDDTPYHFILHTGTNDLRSEKTAS